MNDNHCNRFDGLTMNNKLSPLIRKGNKKQCTNIDRNNCHINDSITSTICISIPITNWSADIESKCARQSVKKCSHTGTIENENVSIDVNGTGIDRKVVKGDKNTKSNSNDNSNINSNIYATSHGSDSSGHLNWQKKQH